MPPTEKQIKFAWFLHKRTEIPLPDNWKLERDICGAFIAFAHKRLGVARYSYVHEKAEKVALPRWGREWCAQSKYVDDDIIRILGGGPLKNEPGPWDEAWCAAQ